MRLTTKVISTLLGLLAALMTIVGTVSIQREKYVLRQYHESYGKSTASIIATACIEAMISEDYPLLETFIQTTGKENKDILFLEIIQKDTVVAQYTHLTFGQTYSIFMSDIRFEYESSGRYLDLGKVRLYLSDHFNKELINSRIRELIYFIVLIFLTTFGGTTFLLRKSVLNKIQFLSDHTKKIGSGDLKTRAEITSDDELGELARSFNEMSDNLYTFQKEIQQQNIDLKEKAITLEKLSHEAQAANRAKSEFIANISHEVRTPLNAISGDTEQLITIATDRKYISRLQSIQKAGDQLLSIFNDILDMSKIEAGKMDLIHHPINIPSIIQDVSGIFEKQCRQKGLNTEIEIDPQLPAGLILDGIRLRQILVNLVGNAVKFTHQGKLTIQAGLRSSQKSSTCDIVIKIADTGIGIAPDQQKNIFKLFYQKDGGKNRDHEGTGLGLTITHKLVEMMNGKIHLSSSLDVGTRIEISFFDIIISDVSSASLDGGGHADQTMLENNRLEAKIIKKISLSEGVDNLPGLVAAINKDFIPKLDLLKEPLEINDVTDFSIQLTLLCEKHSASGLAKYADSLLQAADEFDLLKIQNLIKQFPVLFDQLRNNRIQKK